MFSNSSRYAIEETIREFNDFLQTKVNLVKYSAIDLKNAFYQRFRKNFRSTNDWHTAWYQFEMNNLLLTIENGVLVNVKFVVTNEYNSKQKEFIEDLNDAMKHIDLAKIANQNIVYSGILEHFNSTINQINNFKINK